MSRFALYPTELEPSLAAYAGESSIEDFVNSLLYDSSGTPRGLTLALLATEGIEPFIQEVAEVFGCRPEEISDTVSNQFDTAASNDFLLTGAEAVTLILRNAGVKTAFAYAGTSELSLCDSLARIPDIELVNGRGDKESAFMSAGAGLLESGRGIAVLHGARGLTNAAGAVADARRNEAGTIFIVGLPSTSSAPFLPPHGEYNLMQSMGNFVKWWHEAGPVPNEEAARAHAATRFVEALRGALDHARRKPYGPVLFGLPQDVAEAKWVPWSTVVADEPELDDTDVSQDVSPEQISAAVDLLERSQRALVFVDDYLLKYEGVQEALAGFAAASGSPVLQVRYRRGAMLFERLSAEDVPSFVGWYDPLNPHHRELMSEADLLVTLEDRNMYRRVVGELPDCRKLAINSDATKVWKNQYMSGEDLLIEGDVVAILETLQAELSTDGEGRTSAFWASDKSGEALEEATEVPQKARYVRAGVVGALSNAMETFEHPVLVDDSQMFGGLLAEEYDRLPTRLRVFGGHGGFVGGGTAYATGLAIADPSVRVFCTLGDQGFTNSFQGMVAAVQQRARIIFLVCNNGESVSLLKQSNLQEPEWFDGGRHPYLHNPAGPSYAGLASQLGVTSSVVEVPTDRGASEIDGAISAFKARLAEASTGEGPHLIELQLPSLGEFWTGIWQTKGFEQVASTVARQ